jgi:hypothetical protein
MQIGSKYLWLHVYYTHFYADTSNKLLLAKNLDQLNMDGSMHTTDSKRLSPYLPLRTPQSHFYSFVWTMERVRY